MTAAWRKLGIIAGGGDLPLRIAEHCRAQAQDYFVSRIAGVAAPALAAHPGADADLDKMGARFEALHGAGCDAVVLVGQVRRPDFSRFAPDAKTVDMLPRILAAAGQGDDALLRALIAECEREGFRVVGAEDVLAGLLMRPGPLGAHAPDAAALKDIAKAAKIVGALGALDVGQGAVVANGLTLAVEAQEGTDAMLARVAGLPDEIRGGGRGVLLKRAKPTQDRRIDLPVIGLATLDGAARAGLAGVAAETGAVLVVDKAAVAARADDLGLFVFGFAADTP